MRAFPCVFIYAAPRAGPQHTDASLALAAAANSHQTTAPLAFCRKVPSHSYKHLASIHLPLHGHKCVGVSRPAFAFPKNAADILADTWETSPTAKAAAGTVTFSDLCSWFTLKPKLCPLSWNLLHSDRCCCVWCNPPNKRFCTSIAWTLPLKPTIAKMFIFFNQALTHLKMLCAWRIIRVSKWLITMLSKSPKWGCSPYKWPTWLVNRGY